MEGFAHACLADGVAKGRDMIGEQGTATVQQANREEEGPARNPVVAVVGHGQAGQSQVVVMSIGAKWLLINGRFYTRIFFDRDPFPRVKEKHART